MRFTINTNTLIDSYDRMKYLDVSAIYLSSPWPLRVEVSTRGYALLLRLFTAISSEEVEYAFWY